jgi:hypothetical protein
VVSRPLQWITLDRAPTSLRRSAAETLCRFSPDLRGRPVTATVSRAAVSRGGGPDSGERTGQFRRRGGTRGSGRRARRPVPPPPLRWPVRRRSAGGPEAVVAGRGRGVAGRCCSAAGTPSGAGAAGCSFQTNVQSRQSPRTVRTHRSAKAFACGACGGVRTTCTPADANTASNAVLNLASRSRIRYRNR